MSNKRALLLFSGGVDSTYQLWTNHRAGVRTDLLYVDCGQSSIKVKAEKKARDLIKAELREMFPEGYGSRELETQSSIRFAVSPCVGFSQAPGWFVSALEAVDPRIHTEVQIAYLANDQISGYLDRLITAWDALWDIVKGAEKVPLTFPTRMLTKETVIRLLPNDLYRLTWVCETPKTLELPHDRVAYDPCGQCSACITRQVESYRHHLRGNGFKKDVWSDPGVRADVLAGKLSKPVTLGDHLRQQTFCQGESL